MSRFTMLAFVYAAAPGIALAHHGFGTFDRNSNIEVRGVVTGVDFVNPHAWVYFDVTEEDGRVSAWRCELRSATMLRRSGWSADMFVAGEPIIITGALDRNDPHSCYVSTAVFADGTRANRYAQLSQGEPIRPVVPAARAPRLPSGEPNLAGDWAPEQLVMTDPRGRGGALVPLSVLDQYEPGEGRIANPASVDGEAEGGAVTLPYRTRGVELTEVGRQAAESFGTYTLDNPRMRCETTSVLFDWTFDGPTNRITQLEGRIVLEYGQLGFTRTIHTNMAAHPEGLEPSRAGHSIGHWEGDVLVVETIGFEPGVLSPPILHSDRLRVVERFSLDPETMALTREYAAEDPVYFVGQYRGSDTVYPAHVPYSPDPCEELSFIDYSQEGRPRTAPAREAPRLADPELAGKLAAGVWRSVVAGGTNVYDFPLTPEGQARFENYRLDLDSSLTCEPPGMPRAFYNLSPMAFSFEEDSLTIFYETMDVERTVRIDGAPLPASAPHTPNGHAVGRWQGNMLIVDTTHLSAGETTRDGVPKSELMTLRETFSVEDRGGRSYLIVTVTITDPANFREPFTSINEFVLEPDWELLPFDCHPMEYQR